MYTFCSKFRIHVFVTFVGIRIFFKVGGITLRCSNPRSFIFHCVLLTYLWEAFQNSFLSESIFYGKKIITHIESLDWIIQSTKSRLYLNPYSLLFLTPIYLPSWLVLL